MNRRVSKFAAALFLVPFLGTFSGSLALGAPDVEAVLKQMPADFPLGAVVVDFDKFDKNVIAYAKAINPKSDFEGMLADLKKDMGIAPWIDFTKPVGMAQPSLQGGDPIMWATVPNFKEKVKTVADAKEEEGGIWFLPFEEKEDLYVAVKGDLVVAARDKSALESALKKEGRTLADDLRPRMDLLTNRDIYVHLNFDPIRPMALAGIAQGAQMAPMMAMMAAQQGGGDPASMTAVFTGILDAVKNFSEQAAFVDIAFGITPAAATATIATGFKDGPIKDYLAKNKPASAPLLTTVEEQPFTMAMAWHIPGEDSPFLNYVFDKMGSAPAGGAAPAAGEKSAAAEGAELARDLYRKVEGMNAVMHMTKQGMTASGDYLGKDVAGIQDLAKKSMVKENPIAAMMSSGISYEAGGSKKLGDKNVDVLTIKIDTSNPAAEHAAKMFGPNTTMYMGPMEGRVGYFLGPEAEAQKYFTGKVAKPLASAPLVAEALKNLPAKRNLVVLIDPAGVLPALGPLMGGADIPENMTPGPPVAISTSLSGEYARTDIHVPAKAIGRVVETMTPAPPM